MENKARKTAGSVFWGLGKDHKYYLYMYGKSIYMTLPKIEAVITKSEALWVAENRNGLRSRS